MAATADSPYAKHTLLIANRGEIAVRILKTAKKMGLRTITVYTPADAISPHATLADISLPLPMPPCDSESGEVSEKVTTTEGAAYLSPAAFLDICKAYDVTLLHPGYGFLSENAEFAEMVTQAGVTWLGPQSSTIRTMGLKHEARKIVEDVARISDDPDLELYVVPGSTDPIKNAEEAAHLARHIGFPVLFKASAGGGGLGMVLCERTEDIVDAFQKAVQRAETLFNNPAVLLEKYFPRARHIEVQVFGDGEGSIIHLGERECSIQRRHQKVIEECPSPFLESRRDLRVKICNAAVALCRYIQYDYAGTVEFLVDDQNGKFYFLEMNTRIQVEHPVTEMAYSDIDLVEMMIRHGVAKREGKLSPIEFTQTTFDDLWKAAKAAGGGYAIEGRIYAENPAEAFLPCPGLLQKVPDEKFEWLRIDTWVSTGMQVTPHFDPLLAKLVVKGSTRQEAIERFIRAIEQFSICGPPNNLDFLKAIAQSPAFCAGQTTTKFLDELEYLPHALKVITAGLEMSIQDLTGRTVGRGVPRSGAMDPISFSVGNLLVGNAKETEGIEAIVVPGIPICIQFLSTSLIAVTGKQVTVRFNDAEMKMWSSVLIPAGGSVTIAAREGTPSGGLRTYILVRGGFPNVPHYLGSKSTSVGIGGYQARNLIEGDFLSMASLDAMHSSSLSPYTLPSSLILTYPKDWVICVLAGPHDDEEYVTQEGISRFYSTRWKVSSSSNRMGIRLESEEKILWSRTDGGEGGAHPSNILDNAYALGSVNINGDTPIILTNEGPDMGGYVCLCTVASGELWKLGQLGPGCTVQFRRVSHAEALDIQDQNERYLNTIERSIGGEQSEVESLSDDRAYTDKTDSPILAHKLRESCTLRQAGDVAILVEFGEMKVDFHVRARVQALLEALESEHFTGIQRLSPCIRSLMVYYEPKILPQRDLVDILKLKIEAIPIDLSHLSFAGRRITLPIVLDDPWTQDAIKHYMNSIRQKAVYLPSNVEYLARNNGLGDIKETFEKLMSTDWVAFGVGFYFACPFLVPMDPRSRLVGQKYNPSRTFTPRGSVGIAGPVTAIYPIDGPGGYQLFGRTLPPWQTWGKGENFSLETPWLLRPFDQIRFEPIDTRKYEKVEMAFERGHHVFQIEDVKLSMEAYTASYSAVESEIDDFRKRQISAREEQAAIERVLLVEWERDKLSGDHLESQSAGPARDENSASIKAALFASVFKIHCRIGDMVHSVGQELMVLEAMKSEIPVKASQGLVGKIVEAFGHGVKPGAQVAPGDVLVHLT